MRSNLAALICLILFSACDKSREKLSGNQAFLNIQTTELSEQEEKLNPIIPGWFADPTIKKFDGIYYIYATTDNEMLASGAPTVWYSADFKNWYNYTMEIPSLDAVNLRNYWAPDIVKGDDGKYYLYFGNCQAGCNIYGYVSDTPVGPWEKLQEDDTPVISHGFPREGFPSLDAQFFRDDDGKIFAYWGTWVHYNGGYAVGELNADTMNSINEAKNIPLAQTPKPFEAPYMLKKGKKYLLMYSGGSCHDGTYNVRYSYSNSPWGPLTPGANNPVLSTTEDERVHGPGHHSVLQEGNDYYIVYHKHDYPMTRGGLARQICVDELNFKNDSTLLAVKPGTSSLSKLNTSSLPEDLTYNALATATSSYNLEIPDLNYTYSADKAVDHNHATMWKAASNVLPQSLNVDLGAVHPVKRIATSFEFASYYYQYQIEYSVDGENWNLFADRSDNRISGSPILDDGNVEARYLKLTILATEKTGLFAAVWNFKVYGELFSIPLPELRNKTSVNPPASKALREQLIDLDAEGINAGDTFASVENKGTYGGEFSKEGRVSITEEDGIKVFQFTNGALILNKPVPESLAWNGAFTVSAWVKNPEVAQDGECLASWCDRYKFGLANSYNAFFYNSSNYGAAAHLDAHFDMPYKQVPEADKWHHLVLTFDGVTERVYVDGKLDNAQIMTLASQVENAKLIIGSSDAGEGYSGYLASLKFYDHGMEYEEIQTLHKESSPFR